MSSFKWPPTGAGSNEFTSIILDGSISGKLTLEAAATTTDYTILFPAAQGGSGQTLVNDGSGNLSWQSAAAITIGAFGSAPNANGLTLTGDALNMQPADGTHPGGVSIAAQTLSGAKTFSTAPVLSSLTASLPLQLDASKNITAAAINLSGSQITGILAATSFPALTGDVVTSAGALATTIAANVVANSKLAQMATLTIKGNNTGGLANALDLTVAQVNTMLGSLSNPMTTLGDIIYEDATPQPVRLAGNTTSTLKALTQTGTGTISAVPVWTSAVSTNTASTLVARDGSGNFSAGTISAALTGTASGNTTISGQANHGVVVSGAASAMTSTAAGSSGQPLLSGGASADPAYGTLAIGAGGTGQTSKSAAFDALQPMTTGGDIIYGGASGTGTRLANGSAGQVLTSAGSTSAPTWSAAATSTLVTVASTSPGTQRNLSTIGSGGYGAMSGGSVSLTTGTWQIDSYYQVNNGTGTGCILYSGTGLYGANGGDSGTVPALLSTIGTVSGPATFSDTTGGSIAGSNNVAGEGFSVHLTTYLKVTSTQSVFAVPRVDFTAAGSGQVAVYLVARQIF